MRALRQVCAAGVRWGYMTRNPAALAGANPAPPPRPFAPTRSRSSTRSRPNSASDTGRRPVRRRDGAAAARVGALERAATVDRASPRARPYAATKTTGSVREVPLTRRALDALDRLPAQARHPRPVRGRGRARHQPQQLPPARLAARRRGFRDRNPGADLRPALDVRVERARRRGHRVRAREGDGHLRRDDRAALRDADRRRPRRDRRTARRVSTPSLNRGTTTTRREFSRDRLGRTSGRLRPRDASRSEG